MNSDKKGNPTQKKRRIIIREDTDSEEEADGTSSVQCSLTNKAMEAKEQSNKAQTTLTSFCIKPPSTSKKSPATMTEKKSTVLPSKSKEVSTSDDSVVLENLKEQLILTTKHVELTKDLLSLHNQRGQCLTEDVTKAKLKLDSIRASISDIVPKEKKRDYVDELIEKLDLKKLHLNQAQCRQLTAFQCRGTKRYLSYRRFDEFPWLVWKTSVNRQLDADLQSDQPSNLGKAFCGICTNAQERGFCIDANQSKFVRGMHDWRRDGSVDHLKNHQNHRCHIEAIKFLFNHFQPATVIDQINVQANTNLADIQKSNRHFFASIIHAMRFLGGNGDSFFGDTSQEGRLRAQLEYAASFDTRLSTHMERAIGNPKYILNLQHNVVKFILMAMEAQVLQYIHLELTNAKFACLIVDEWTCVHSNRQYCSISLRFVTHRLEVNTRFLGYHYLEKANATTIVDVIVQAMNRTEPHVPLNMIVVQTYDGASVMQGVSNGVQAKFRQLHSPFAIGLHCTVHRLNLGAKSSVSSSQLLKDVIAYCRVIIKLIRFSPKRNAHFNRVKSEILNDEDAQLRVAKTIRGMILLFSITRWTTRKDSFISILGNYVPTVKTFVEIMSNTADRQGLDSEHEAEVIGMLSQMQDFRFFFGLKLCILIFIPIDVTATCLQKDDINISDAMSQLKKLRRKLLELKDNFEDFWEDVEQQRNDLNNRFQEDDVVGPSPRFDQISDGSIDEDIPRLLRRPLREVPSNEGHKAYWRELYLQTFEEIIDEIEERMESPALSTFKQIESLLVEGIIYEDFVPQIDKIENVFGRRVGAPDGIIPPLQQDMTSESLKPEIAFLRERWRNQRQARNPGTFEDVASMVVGDVRDHLSDWKANAPNVFNMVAIVLVAAGTSAFAERTFSLSRRIKTWLRSHMHDDTFAACGLLAWYGQNNKKEFYNMLDLVKIANDFANSNSGRRASYGNFCLEDFPNL